MEHKKETLGQRLRRLRLKKGLTVEETAKSVGVATSTYREWEYGRSIRGEPYDKLAEILESTIYEIITGSPHTNSQAFTEIDKIEFHVKALKAELNKTL